jgi:hypothetical protein
VTAHQPGAAGHQPRAESRAGSVPSFEELMSEVMAAAGRFGHREHVRLTWLAVRRCGLPAAIGLVSDGIQRTARYAGAPQKYHATVSRAWVELVGHHALEWVKGGAPDRSPDRGHAASQVQRRPDQGLGRLGTPEPVTGRPRESLKSASGDVTLSGLARPAPPAHPIRRNRRTNPVALFNYPSLITTHSPSHQLEPFLRPIRPEMWMPN